VFNDLVFTPQVASQVEAELRRSGRYIHMQISERMLQEAQHFSWHRHLRA